MRIASWKTTAKDIDPSSRIGIVYSSFYPNEVSALVEGAKEIFLFHGIEERAISLHECAGSFEIPLIGASLAQAKTVDALIGLGIIIEGETHHADLIAREAARGIMDVQVRYRIPFAFEVLYVKDIAHARERALDTVNRGKDAAYAVLHSLAQSRKCIPES